PARRNRIDQLADAMHDEAGLRAVFAAARRSRDRQRVVRLLLFQSGSASRRGRLHQSPRAAATEHGGGEVDEPLAHAIAGEAGSGAGDRRMTRDVAEAIATAIAFAFPIGAIVMHRHYRGATGW